MAEGHGETISRVLTGSTLFKKGHILTMNPKKVAACAIVAALSDGRRPRRKRRIKAKRGGSCGVRRVPSPPSCRNYKRSQWIFAIISHASCEPQKYIIM